MNQAYYHEHIMELALNHAQMAGTLFGAAIAMGSEVVEVCANRVREKHDPTAHAEMEVIREVSALTHRTNLSGYSLYTTVEPCPMCASACVWSNLDAIYYGLSIDEVSNYLPQISVPSSDIIAAGFRDLKVYPGILHKQCLAYLKSFSGSSS